MRNAIAILIFGAWCWVGGMICQERRYTPAPLTFDELNAEPDDRIYDPNAYTTCVEHVAKGNTFCATHEAAP